MAITGTKYETDRDQLYFPNIHKKYRYYSSVCPYSPFRIKKKKRHWHAFTVLYHVTGKPTVTHQNNTFSFLHIFPLPPPRLLDPSHSYTKFYLRTVILPHKSSRVINKLTSKHRNTLRKIMESREP